MIKIGVTGGIATGKSTVLNIMRNFGASTCSADEIAQNLMRSGTDLTWRVCQEFPDCCSWSTDGTPSVDRQKLGSVVFTDTRARQVLDSLTHPRIVEVLRSTSDAWNCSGVQVGAIEIPLLYEAGLENMVDFIVVVACSETEQIRRLTERGLSESDAQARISAQLPQDLKEQKANVVVRTDLSTSQLRSDVQAVLQSL